MHDRRRSFCFYGAVAGFLWVGSFACAPTAGARVTAGHDGSAAAAFVRGDFDPNLGASDATCIESDASGTCKKRERRCVDGDVRGFTAIAYDPKRIGFWPCDTQFPVDKMMREFDLRLGQQVGTSTDYGKPIYATDNPRIFVELRTAGGLTVNAFYLIARGADWRVALPLDGSSDPGAVWKLGSLVADCPTDRREHILKGTRSELQTASTLDADRRFLLAAQLSACGEEEEATSHILGSDARSMWDSARPNALAIAELSPSLRKLTAHHLLTSPSRSEAAARLDNVARILVDAARGAYWVAEGARPNGWIPGPSSAAVFRPYIARLADTGPECWPRREATVRKAAQDGRFATAATLLSTCRKGERQSITPKAGAPNFSGDADAYRRELARALVLALGRQVVFEPEHLRPNWNPATPLTSRISALTLVDFETLAGLPKMRQSITMDVSGVDIKETAAHSYTVGASEAEQKAEWQRFTGEVTAEAKRLLARRNALREEIAAADAAIKNAKPTEYSRAGSKAPEGTVTTKREWTDRFGVTHTETTTSKQGGQTMGGVRVTVAADTSAAEAKKSAAERELTEVLAKLSALESKAQTKSANTKLTKPETRQARASVAYRGFAKVRLSLAADGDEKVRDLRVDFTSSDGAYGAIDQLAQKGDDDVTRAFQQLALPVFERKRDELLGHAKGTPTELADERVLLDALLGKDSPSNDLVSVRLRKADLD